MYKVNTKITHRNILKKVRSDQRSILHHFIVNAYKIMMVEVAPRPDVKL